MALSIERCPAATSRSGYELFNPTAISAIKEKQVPDPFCPANYYPTHFLEMVPQITI